MICSVLSVNCIGRREKKVKLVLGQNLPKTKSQKIQNLIYMNVNCNDVDDGLEQDWALAQTT